MLYAMDPAAVKGALELFAACLAVHLALWRWRPARRIPVLFAVFFAPPLVLLACAPSAVALGVALGHFALACAYIQSYPAMVPAAPTLRILLLVAAREPEGATAEQLRGGFGAQGLVAEAVEPLLVGNLLRRQKGSDRLEITARGRALVWPFLLLRRIIGLPPGDG